MPIPGSCAVEQNVLAFPGGQRPADRFCRRRPADIAKANEKNPCGHD